MKKHVFKISFLLIAIIFAQCEKEKIEFADENIIINTQSPGFAIYKTNKDYFEYVVIKLDSLGNITQTPGYNLNSVCILQHENGQIFYTWRWKLKSGYIVDKEMGYKNTFTNISFQELVEYIEKNGGDIPDSWFKERIIDENPFVSYYYTKGDTIPREFTLGEINDMIENGTLETVFTKIK